MAAIVGADRGVPGAGGGEGGGDGAAPSKRELEAAGVVPQRVLRRTAGALLKDTAAAAPARRVEERADRNLADGIEGHRVRNGDALTGAGEEQAEREVSGAGPHGAVHERAA